MAQLLRIAAALACGLVVMGFVLFANQQLSAGSEEQVSKVNQTISQPAPSSTDEQLRERRHGTVHETIDDANDVLLAPFAGLVSPGDDPWVQRLVPDVLALLVYGAGLMMLANFLPKPRNAPTDWRGAGTST
jgi:hypothetical protein